MFQSLFCYCFFFSDEDENYGFDYNDDGNEAFGDNQNTIISSDEGIQPMGNKLPNSFLLIYTSYFCFNHLTFLTSYLQHLSSLKIW